MPNSIERSDPLRRRVAWVVFLGATASVLLGQVALWLGIVSSLATALLFSYLLSRELRPLRRRIEPIGSGELRAPTPGEMAVLLDRATERESETREALRIERDDLVDILHATANGLVLLDQDERIQLVNDASSS